MNILKHKAIEYLGIKQNYFNKLLLSGKLKNHDVNHITLESLIDYQVSKRIQKDAPKRPRLSTTLKSIRIEDNKLIMVFPSQKNLFNFTDKLKEHVLISLTGKKIDGLNINGGDNADVDTVLTLLEEMKLKDS